ncbi:MAG: hypothetical protein ACTHLE_02040 [Agriterribacter sp.]
MVEKPYTSDIKTVLKVDERFEKVRYMFHSMLRDGKDVPKSQKRKNRKNSFSFGWVKSFSIITINVKLIKESDRSTVIWIEAGDHGEYIGEKRLIYDGFYDFLQFLKKKFAHRELNAGISDRAESAGAWAMLFIILLTLFLGWYYLFAN